jgi:threonine 3-dehydrogenase
MKALIFDTARGAWESSTGFEKAEVPDPVIDEAHTPSDAHAVIIKIRFAGVCGSDRGIWFRTAFRDQILDSLAEEKKTRRILGHEFAGEVVAVGSQVTRAKVGDFVSCESHVVCNACYQCLRGEHHVCTNEKILGISHDGGFAEYAKVPQHIVWVTNTGRIRPEIAAVQEPFGNAVHAASKADLQGKTVAVFGLGPIGMTLSLVIRGLGAKTIIGADPNPVARRMAARLGVDHILTPGSAPGEKSYAHDPGMTEEIVRLTGGIGADVSFEMSGFNPSVNNALFSTRRGGEIILFGLKNGDFVFEDYNRLIVRGFTLHAVIGRRIWQTWETTRTLLEDRANGIQEKLWSVILNEGRDTIIPIDVYTKKDFEQKISAHPKILLQF